MSLKVGVVGVGHLGQHHARIYSELPDVDLVAVCDVMEDRARAVARRTRSKAVRDHRELFGKIGAVSIAVPTPLHHRIARDFLQHGIHVLVEKPITTTVEEADELLKIAQEKNLTLQVGHLEHFNAGFQEVEKLARNPRFIECHRLGPFRNRNTDVGVVLDLMIHDIDIILGLVRSPVERVEGVGVKVLTEHEDIANARIAFANKTVCNLTASRLTPDEQRKIRIFVEDAYISLDYVKQEALIFHKDGQKITRQAINIKKQEPLKKELEAFVSCVKLGERPVVSGKEGRDALALALEITRQIRENYPS